VRLFAHCPECNAINRIGKKCVTCHPNPWWYWAIDLAFLPAWIALFHFVMGMPLRW